MRRFDRFLLWAVVAAVLGGALLYSVDALSRTRGKQKKNTIKVNGEMLRLKKVKALSNTRGRRTIVRLNHVSKLLVFHRNPTPVELDALSNVNNLIVRIRPSEGKAPQKDLYSVIKPFDKINFQITLPVTMSEKDAEAVTQLPQAQLVFDASNVDQIPEDFYYIQADYFPFRSKIVLLPQKLITPVELKTMLDLRSFNLEIPLESPLSGKQRKALAKIVTNVHKEFVVPNTFPRKGLKGISRLKNSMVLFDLRSEQDIKKAIAKLQRGFKKLRKAVIVNGPFDERTAAAISLWENIAELRIDVGDSLSEDFIYMLNRKK